MYIDEKKNIKVSLKHTDKTGYGDNFVSDIIYTNNTFKDVAEARLVEITVEGNAKKVVKVIVEYEIANSANADLYRHDRSATEHLTVTYEDFGQYSRVNSGRSTNNSVSFTEVSFMKRKKVETGKVTNYIIEKEDDILEVRVERK